MLIMMTGVTPAKTGDTPPPCILNYMTAKKNKTGVRKNEDGAKAIGHKGRVGAGEFIRELPYPNGCDSVHCGAANKEVNELCLTLWK